MKTIKKRFIRERKNILKITATVILCAAIFSLVEIFLFKGAFIVFSVTLALGSAITLIHFYFQNYKSKIIRKLIEENDIEKLKDFKFYDVSRMNGAYELTIDSFNVKGAASKCRLMYCIEMLPILFIAVQAILTVSLEKSVSYLWGLGILFFFIMLNINTQLSFIYKNSVAVKEITNYVNDFENHILLHKSMFFAYVFLEVAIAILGFLCIFVPAVDFYWWIIFIAVVVAIAGILFGTAILIKKHTKNNSPLK